MTPARPSLCGGRAGQHDLEGSVEQGRKNEREACLGADLGVAWLMAGGVKRGFLGVRVDLASPTLGQR